MKPWEKARETLDTAAQNATGIGTIAATNVATFNVAPQMGGGAEVTALAVFLNGFAQWLKWRRSFDEKAWLIPVLFVAGVALVWVIWQDHVRAFVDASLATGQALTNYWGQKVTTLPNVLAATPPDLEYRGGSNATTT